MIGNQRVVFEIVARDDPLRRRLLAASLRRAVGILCLLELVGGDQVLFRLGAIAIELLFCEQQAMLGRIEGRLRARCLPLRIDRIELRHGLALLDGIADPDLALDQLAGNPKRHRVGIPRRHLDRIADRAATGAGTGVRVYRQSHH